MLNSHNHVHYATDYGHLLSFGSPDTGLSDVGFTEELPKFIVGATVPSNCVNPPCIVRVPGKLSFHLTSCKFVHPVNIRVRDLWSGSSVP